MKILIAKVLLVSMLFSANVYAVDNIFVASLLKEVKLDKTKFNNLIDSLVKTNQIPKEDGDLAKSKVGSMTKTEVEALKEGLITILEKADSRNPINEKDLDDLLNKRPVKK